MLLDVKKLLARLVKPATVTEVSLPFTPSSNGLLMVRARLSNGGRGYAIINNASPNIVDGYSTTGAYINTVLFVERGQAVSLGARDNLSEITGYFVPLWGGYCVTSVFSRLSAAFRRLEVA